MSKHTKGPWIAIPMNIRFINGASKPIFNDGIWHIFPSEDTEQLPICTIDYADDCHEGTRKSAKDVARLIAAAPELLEALIQAVAWMDGERTPINALAHARSIIAKARGEQA